MRSSKHNNPESWRRDDVNLRRALQQRNSNLPLLPEDFADRVMKKVEAEIPAPTTATTSAEPAAKTKRRYLWPIVATALSTAALLALVFILNRPITNSQQTLAREEDKVNETVETLEANETHETYETDETHEVNATHKANRFYAANLSRSSNESFNEPANEPFIEPVNEPVQPADSSATDVSPATPLTLSPVDLDQLDQLVAKASKNTYMIKEERDAREKTTPQQASRLALALNLSMSGSDRSSSDISHLSRPSDKAARYFLPAGNGYTYDLNNQEAVRKSMILEYRSSQTSVEEKYYSMPITLGINIRWNMTQRWALESGLNYTYLYSSSKDEYDHTRQQIHYLGIPLRGLWQFFQRRHWSIYVSAGGSIEFPVSATNTTSHVAIEQPTITETSTLSAPIQFSTDIGLGVQYSLSRHLGFFAEPRLQWHIPTGSNIETYYTRHPLHFNPSLGLRLTL